ncbi:MAG: hypothetical protein ACI8XB_000351 [Patiriisocius sp.]|jgi:hypothetical protein
MKEEENSEDQELLSMIKNRSCLKRDVYENIIRQFEDLKSVLKEYAENLKADIQGHDERIRVKYVEKSKAEVHLIVAGDILVFQMHSNVFSFEPGHHIWQSSYVKENKNNAFVGTINIYNFLNDSFDYNRYNDLGYLIARLFINKEDHYFAEGKKELGYRFNDFVNSKMTKKNWVEIINTCLMYTLDFNLHVPPYNEVNMVTVGEIMEKGASLQIKTGKRLGFHFSDESKGPIA